MFDTEQKSCLAPHCTVLHLYKHNDLKFSCIFLSNPISYLTWCTGIGNASYMNMYEIKTQSQPYQQIPYNKRMWNFVNLTWHSVSKNHPLRGRHRKERSGAEGAERSPLGSPRVPNLQTKKRLSIKKGVIFSRCQRISTVPHTSTTVSYSLKFGSIL